MSDGKIDDLMNSIDTDNKTDSKGDGVATIWSILITFAKMITF